MSGNEVAKPRPSAIQLDPLARRVEKPWGWELIWAEGSAYTGKLLHINAGKRLSLQYHDEKLETQCLVSGRAMLVVEDADGALQEILMEPGKGYTIVPFQLHRLVAIDDAEIYEVSTAETGTTVRVDDDFERPNETPDLRDSHNRGWTSHESRA